MARVSEIYVGARFGMLTVAGERTTGKLAEVRVRCDCGNERSVRICNLGISSTSCGCVRLQRLAAQKTTHGLSGTPEYRIWTGIITRCTNPGRKSWKDYGGRGITICDEWRNDFEAFLVHTGRRPSARHSIDRIDNDGNYEPGNVRWATPREQRENQRARARTVCSEGHPLEGDNLVVSAKRRDCRECLRRRKRERAAQRRERNRAERAAAATYERWGRRRLTDDQVVEIRQRLAIGERVSALSNEYGVAHSTISRIGSELSWKHQPPGDDVISPRKVCER